MRSFRSGAGIAGLSLLLALASGAAASTDTAPIAIAIHGGAGTISRDKLSPELEAAYRAKLTEAVRAGYALLAADGSSVDAVIAAVEILEASPLFNAGVGAVMTWDGAHELDASLMSGGDRAAGAVAGVRTIRSPIRAARAVITDSPHVLLAGSGAEAFAREQGLAMVTNDHFTTERRRNDLQRVKARRLRDSDKAGTVGAVALDRHGNLAAGTSTGGMTGKRWGRVGDSPIIGAGTWADNRSCAVSATGHGEYFIRYHVAGDICARVRYRQLPIAEAARQVLFDELEPAGGTGGVIVVDPAGNVAMPFNTSGMYRAAIDGTGALTVAIFAD